MHLFVVMIRGNGCAGLSFRLLQFFWWWCVLVRTLKSGPVGNVEARFRTVTLLWLNGYHFGSSLALVASVSPAMVSSPSP